MTIKAEAQLLLALPTRIMQLGGHFYPLIQLKTDRLRTYDPLTVEHLILLTIMPSLFLPYLVA